MVMSEHENAKSIGRMKGRTFSSRDFFIAGLTFRSACWGGTHGGTHSGTHSDSGTHSGTCKCSVVGKLLFTSEYCCCLGRTRDILERRDPHCY